MFRNSRTSRPLTALVALMALGLGGCNVGEIGPIDWSGLLDDIPGPLENGKSVTNLTQKQTNTFSLLAGGANYQPGTSRLIIYPNTLDGDFFEDRSDFFRRDFFDGAPLDEVGLNVFFESDDGSGIFFSLAFLPEDLDDEQSGPFKSYTKFGVGDAFSTFSVVEPGEAILGLEYATFGSWNDTRGTPDSGFFFSGVPTKTAGMPKSGAATYAGLTIGAVFDADSNRSALAGDMALSVNFGDGSVDGDFTNMMKTGADGNVTPWRDFTMAASINAGTDNFTGTTITNDGLLSGQAEGAFFGPGAAEVAGAWTLSGDGEIALGSFGGGQN